MNYKILRCIKRIVVSVIGAIVLTSILFFMLVAPHRTVPILMYHNISSVEQQDDVLSISKKVFREQMEYISKHNYKVISLKELAEMLQKGINIPSNYVVLTFDDGYGNFYNHAYPILKENKFKATVFVIIGFIEKNKETLNWEQIEQLAKDDLIDIGSHTLTHQMLPLLNDKEAKQEILFSKLSLEKKLKEPVVIFCYPFGAVNHSIKEMVKKAGFKVAVGTSYQRGQFNNNDVYILKRVCISKISKYPFIFKFMLSGYYIPTKELILRALNIKVPRDFYTPKNKEKDYN